MIDYREVLNNKSLSIENLDDRTKRLIQNIESIREKESETDRFKDLNGLIIEGIAKHLADIEAKEAKEAELIRENENNQEDSRRGYGFKRFKGFRN